MGNITCNIALGRVVELYNRVKSNDPANSALVLVPLETSGLEADSVLKDAATLAALLSGTTNEQTTMGRKVLTDSDLAALPAPDNALNKRQCSLPATTWTAASGNAVSSLAVCIDLDTTSGSDTDIIPLTVFDWPQTPSGVDIPLPAGVFYEAA